MASQKNKINAALEASNHRPWELPDTPWAYYQEWQNVLFLHWKVSVKELQTFVPDGLEIDVFEGSAWVSLVCFGMRQVRPRNFPSVGRLSNFDEINLRTYVKKNGKGAVYFLSIHVDEFIASCVARWISGTPYRYKPMEVTERSFSVFNRQKLKEFHVEYETENGLQPTEKDLWLTERYALFQDIRNELKSFDIHHKPWPLQQVSIQDINLTSEVSLGLFSGPPQLAHYSPGVVTLAWNAENL